MSQNNRLNNIERRTNILFNEINSIQTNCDNISIEFNSIRKEMGILSNLAIKFDKFIDSFDNKMSIKKNIFVDDNRNRNNPNNPFIKESNKIIKNENLDQSINKINLNNNSISNENKNDVSNKSIQKHKREKIKKEILFIFILILIIKPIDIYMKIKVL